MNFLTRIAFLPIKQVGALALLAGGLFYYFMFDDGSDLNPKIEQLRADLSAEEQKKLNTERTLKERDRLQEILAKLTEKYEELSRQIPTEINSFELNKQINSLIQAARVRPLARRPRETKNLGILEEIPYELKLMGTYNDIVQFVYLVSSSERVMLAKKIKITPVNPYDGRLNFDVVMSAYKLSASGGEVKKEGTP